MTEQMEQLDRTDTGTRIAILDLPVRSVGIGNQYGKVQN